MLEKFGLVESNISAAKIGDVFGRLSVKAVGQIGGTYRYYAVCQCSCGSPLKRVRIDGLKSGMVVSCGCVQKEKTTKHGMTSSGHLGRWSHMMDRCYNENCRSYKDYGGRGIKVCDAWHDIATFVAALPDGYKKGLEIDRIDNDGDYEPGNIRWATSQQNCCNRRSSRVEEFNGESKVLSRWAEDLGISLSALTRRIDVLGWPIEKALTEPACDPRENMLRAQRLSWKGHVKKTRPEPRVLKTVEWNGKDYTVAELSKFAVVKNSVLFKRIFEKGWEVGRALVTPLRKRKTKAQNDKQSTNGTGRQER